MCHMCLVISESSRFGRFVRILVNHVFLSIKHKKEIKQRLGALWEITYLHVNVVLE